MERSGIICGGTWVVDINYMVVAWPAEETLATVSARRDDGGGPAHNLSVDLCRLGAPFPIWGIGVLGDDQAGQQLLAACARYGIDTRQMSRRSGLNTAQTCVMTSAQTGKRTFFTYQGVGAVLTPADFDFTDLPARWLHLGAPGVHERLDQAWGDDASGWVSILRAARRAGIRTNLEMVSVAPEAMRRLVLPCLAHLDSLIINDYEAGALAELPVVQDGVAQPEIAARAAETLLQRGAMDLVVVHFPAGCVAATRAGERLACASLLVPQAAIKGANGAGDAFAAGVLYGLHEDWPVLRCLELGQCAAASALRSISTTEAVGSVAECLALVAQWGWRAPPAVGDPR